MRDETERIDTLHELAEALELEAEDVLELLRELLAEAANQDCFEGEDDTAAAA